MQNNMYFTQLEILWKIFSEIPTAIAYIHGSIEHPEMKGIAHFYQTTDKVLVLVEMMNLPTDNGMNSKNCSGGIYAVHIHEGTECTGNKNDPFANAMTHFNPNHCGHPYHAGDMPPLFENEGYALNVFVTNRFKVEDVLGKTVIVHDKRDDFTSQPAGNAGTKIACGVIRRV